MRAIDLNHLGRDRVICAWELDGVIIDPGPESCVETLLAGLGGETPRALLLTHIHFDHAGASGALVARFPDLPVYVHARGAPHMEAPARLVASATRLYGEAGLRELWGEVVPVPSANLRVLDGGEIGVEGTFRVAYTPGHASHHVSYLHEPSGWAFTGDVAGVTIAGSDVVIAPTPPPDIDLEAWERSLALIEGWDPSALGITHFGQVTDVAAQLAGVREALHSEAELAGETDLEGFVIAFREQLAARVDPETLGSLLQAAPPEHLWQGLNRWQRKCAEAAAS